MMKKRRKERIREKINEEKKKTLYTRYKYIDIKEKTKSCKKTVALPDSKIK